MPPMMFAVYAVWVLSSSRIAKGAVPTVIDAGTWLHPEVVVASQVAPSITETVLELFAIPGSAT